MPVKARVFGKQQSAHEQRRNVTKRNEVGAGRRHLTWRLEVDLLAHRERGGVRQASTYTHVDGGRAKVTAGAGRYPQAFRHREPGCTQQLREVQMLHAEWEIE